MTNLKFEELAKLYGIEIQDVAAGQGGLFFSDSFGEKQELEGIFESGDYMEPVYESFSLQECDAYSVYSEQVLLLSNAA